MARADTDATDDDGEDRDVLDQPAYLDATAPDPGRSPRSTAWLVAAALVVVLVIGVAVVAVTRSPDESATPTPTTEPDAAEAEELGVAAPYDGKASMRLPITVTPNRDLVDGQMVTVSGTGFPAFADLGVLMCTNEAVFDGIAACDISTAMSSISGGAVTADADGSFSVQYRVRLRFSVVDPDAVTPLPPTPTTYVTSDGDSGSYGGSSGTAATMRSIDCTDGDIDPDIWPTVIPPTAESDPGGFTCIIAAGMVSDYDKSGGAAIGAAGSQFRTFDPSVTHAPPTVVTPAEEPSTTTIPGPAPSSTVVTGATTTTGVPAPPVTPVTTFPPSTTTTGAGPPSSVTTIVNYPADPTR